VSIVVLTYSRPDEIRKNVAALQKLAQPGLEIIVVDNASELPVSGLLPVDERLKVLTLDENTGVGGRNAGIREASGDIVITLDDDVTGITDEDISTLQGLFEDPGIAAVNFMVRDDETDEIINWCHHRKKQEFANRQFDTYEISEGAVAFRRSVALQAGLYPEFFFISHEGPDLAIRIMDQGYRVIYSPDVKVKHSHCLTARISWRRYYYDTRNLIWYVVRSFPVMQGLKMVVIGAGAMFVYSIRDGYFRYWLKGVFDAVTGLGRVLRYRKRISADTLGRFREIEKSNPGFLYMLGQRLFRRNVKI
jgi:GT2 family glycosyltransferase